MAVPTRVTLLRRITDPEDNHAWEEFTRLYAPMVYSFALARGLQHADAADLTQTTLASVARAIQGFEYDQSRGTFRSWLYTIVRRKLCDYFEARSRTPHGCGTTTTIKKIEDHPAPAEEEARWDAEFRRHVFHQAAERAKTEFSPHVWSAFWKTSMEGKSAAEAGEELGMQPGAIYVARHRVIRRLHEIVKCLAEEPSFAA